MTFEFFLFHIFLIFSIVSALMVISLSNAIHSVLFLILTFCNVTLLLLLLGAEFFSFLLLIVYVGAIAVLFLFVIMMLNIKINTSYQNFHVLIPIILIIMLYIGENLYYFTTQFDLLQFFESQLYWISWLDETKIFTTIQVVGFVLYTNYCFIFLLASLILLVAMIGVIVLTMHQKSNLKKQKIELQLLRNPKKLIKFVNLR